MKKYREAALFFNFALSCSAQQPFDLTWVTKTDTPRDELFDPELFELSFFQRPMINHSVAGAGSSYKGQLNCFGRGVALDDLHNLSISVGYAYQTSPVASSASNNVVTNQTTYAMVAVSRNLLTTGAPDTTFNPQGKFGIRKVPGQVVTDLGYPAFAMRVALQTNPVAALQKIVVVGYLQGISNNQVTNSPNAYQLFVLRYTWDGSLDTTFNTKGTPPSSLFPKGFPPGIVIVSLPNNTSLNGNTSQTYSYNNSIAPPLPSQGYALMLLSSHVQPPNDDIVVAGNSNGQLMVAWIRADGILNSTFNPNGFIYNLNVAAQTAGAPLSKQGVLLQGNGVPLLGRPGILTCSLMSNVTLSNTGLAVVGNDCGYALGQLSNGSIVVAGYGIANAGQQQGYTGITLFAVTQAGVPDPTFGSQRNGTVTTPLLRMNSRAYSLVVQSDGKVVIAGAVEDQSSNYYVLVARYLSNGFLDPSFSGPSFMGMNSIAGVQGKLPPGVVYFPLYPLGYSLNSRQNGTLLSYASRIRTQWSGGQEKLIVGGYTQLSAGIPIASLNTHQLTGQVIPGTITVPLVTVSLINSFFAARLTSNGTIDPTFNSAGPTPGQIIIPVRGFGSYDDKVFDCAVDRYGKKVLLYGSSKNNSYNYSQDSTAQCYAFATVCLAENGMLDGSFTNIIANT